jgi:uncharacterized repeat protein (TIGR01451 family)
MTTTLSLRKLGWTLCLIAGLGALGMGPAQASGALELTSTVYQEVDVKAPDGSIAKKLVVAQRVVPGTEVIYHLAYRNTGPEAATEIAIDNPMPKQLNFVEAAATPPTAVSVNGGKTFGRLSELTVVGSDGKPRAARPADVTNLRWVIPALPPGATGVVSFRALVI